MTYIWYAVRPNAETEEWSQTTKDYSEAVEWATALGPNAQIAVFSGYAEHPETVEKNGRDGLDYEACTDIVPISAVRVIGSVMYGVFAQRDGSLSVQWYPRRRKKEALEEAKQKWKQWEQDQTKTSLEHDWVMTGKRRGPFIYENGIWQFAGNDHDLDCIDEVIWTSRMA